MFGLGTIINVAAIVVGGVLGALFGKVLKERHQDTLSKVCGICVLFIAVAGALEGMLTVTEDGLVSGGSLLIIGCLAIGGLIGELLNIEGIYTSFVLYQSEESVYLSARSNNDTNVQIIAEALGGGGNAAGAGARMLATLEEANERLIAALDNYFSSEEETPEEL